MSRSRGFSKLQPLWVLIDISVKRSEEGTMVNHWQGHGQPRFTDVCVEWKLVCVIQSNRQAITAQIAPKLMLVLIERCQNTKWITLCCIWVCIAAEQSECPCWLLSTTISCWWEVQCGQPRSLNSLFGSLCRQVCEPSHHCLIRPQSKYITDIFI